MKAIVAIRHEAETNFTSIQIDRPLFAWFFRVNHSTKQLVVRQISQSAAKYYCRWNRLKPFHILTTSPTTMTTNCPASVVERKSRCVLGSQGQGLGSR